MKENNDQRSGSILELASSPNQNTEEFPTIASFWRRSFAFIVDYLILGLISVIIGYIFVKPLSNLGPYGHPLSLLLFILYFGIMNSKIGKGQTIGKKILKIAIRNKNNKPIELGRSIIHTLFFGIPLSLSGLSIPLASNPLFFGLANIICFGLIGTLLLTMVFNTTAHQGFHDMLLGTYIVNLKKGGKEFPKTPKIQYVISISWLVIICIIYIVFYIINPSTFTSSKVTLLGSNYYYVLNNSNVFSKKSEIRTTYLEGGNTQYDLIVNLWVKGNLSYDEKLEMCKNELYVTYTGHENIADFENLLVNINTGYDFGISRSRNTVYCSNTIPLIKEWIENFTKNNRDFKGNQFET